MIHLFLTAYDPSDLPGTSIDPLGFERGYSLLADKILPGLTNVASRPRYFALLCAGILLCGDIVGSRQEIIRKRRETILRLERFWALANVLAWPAGSDGIRGVTYAQARAEELRRSGATRTDANYPLLSRQSQYGVMGIYTNVASGMRFINRADLSLTPALGEVAAEAFCDETKLPNTLRRAIVENGDISLATLKSWGQEAHVEGEIKPTEAKCLSEALHENSVRSRTAALLLKHPRKNDKETELDRLGKIEPTLRGREGFHDLREAMRCIQEFEGCYRLVSLAFERLLWVSRHHAAASIKMADFSNDFVIQNVRARLPLRVKQLTSVMDDGTHVAFRENLERLADVRGFLEEASTATTDITAFIGAIVGRHTNVQHGKFDRGRRKMPWVELNDERITLTMTRAGGMNREATLPEHIQAHPYRFNAADAFNLASMKALQS